MNIPKEGVKRRIITPDDGAQYFFGYYDLMPYDTADRRHLLHRVTLDYMDRLPTKNDVAQLGYVDTETGEVTYFAATPAWNFQQGAMLQWNPAAPDEEVIYNIRDGEEFRCVTHNLKTGKKKIAERAIANISPDGKWGLAINMPRVYDFRPGYGYGDVRDKFYDIACPEDDGVWLVNMETGAAKLIISYKRIWDEFPSLGYEGAKFVVNHITFNPDSNRFLFLNRNFHRPQDKIWATTLFTSDLEGNLYRLLANTVVSHYHWKNSTDIAGFFKCGEEVGTFILTDMTDKYEKLDSYYFRGDTHTLYSPDRRYLIGDGYPHPETQHRAISIYDFKTNESGILYSEISKAPPIIDNRCDLHNIWSHSAKKISYDSTHRGRRDICELDVSFLYE